MTNLLFASLVLSSLTATAAPSDSVAPDRVTPPPPVLTVATCDPGTDVVIQVDVKSLAFRTRSGSQLTIFASGAWMYGEYRSQAIVKHGRGCLAKSEVATIQKLLAAAKWTATIHDLRCDAVATTRTEFRIDKRLLGDRAVCDGKSYDAATTKAMLHIHLVGQALIGSVK